MKIGICSNLNSAAKVRDMGFDYIEGTACALGGMKEEEFAALRDRLHDVGLPVPSFAGLFPWDGSYQFFSPATTEERLRSYLRTVFSREAALGGKVSVFGSGGARRFPAEVSYADACRRVAEVMRFAGDEAAEFGIRIVFEPLRPAETNIGNSLCEGALLVQLANHPNVSLLADYYHMAVNGEPMSEVTRIGDIRHAHIAARDGRHAPLVTGCDQFGDFIRRLTALGTCERLSIESGWADFDRDAPRALALLRRLAAEAGA